MADYAPLPYVRKAQPRNLRLGDLYLRSGEAAADAATRQGMITAQLWSNLGNTIGQTVQNLGQIPGQERDRKMKEAEAAQIKESRSLQIGEQKRGINERENLDLAMSQVDPKNPQDSRARVLGSLAGRPDLYAKAEQHFDAIDNSFKKLLGDAAVGIREFGDTPDAAIAAMDRLMENGFSEKAIEPYRAAIMKDPTHVKTIVDAMLANSPDPRHQQMVKQPVAPKTREIKTRNADGSESIQIVEDAPGQSFQSAPVPVEPKAKPNPTEASLALEAAGGDPLKALKILNNKPAAAGVRQPIWVMDANGQFLDLAGVAPPGSKPANNREQGRQVTSGDAGRMAEFDNSLKLLSTLGEKLGKTGAQSKVGAMLPNAVTEFTGWGTDAKSRQATIDQVKQIIGKALEGGVLRKEDEIKYEKILPTIGDPGAVAKSKIDGLLQTIGDKRQATLDALADAGYDTSKFTARGAAGKDNEPVKVGGFTVRVKPQ